MWTSLNKNKHVNLNDDGWKPYFNREMQFKKLYELNVTGLSDKTEKCT